MSTTFRPYAPDQSLLLPPDMREWLPEGHLAHHVSDLVDGLDLTAFYTPYEGDGRRNAPYAPRMMVKVLLYAYATGVFSSRQIARKLEEDVAFRMLAAGNFPQHRTLCEFRRRHLSDFQALFVEVVRVAQELGLARLGKLSIDGTLSRPCVRYVLWPREFPLVEALPSGGSAGACAPLFAAFSGTTASSFHRPPSASLPGAPQQTAPNSYRAT